MIHVAAKVGGLFANMQDKVAFFEENMKINMNVIHASHKFGVKRLVCVLSTCIYPDSAAVPMTETDIHKGPPHESNAGYAYAKRMCEIQCGLYRE